MLQNRVDRWMDKRTVKSAMYKAILSWEARVIIYLRFEQNSHVLFGFVTAANWTSRVYNTHGQDADNTGGE